MANQQATSTKDDADLVDVWMQVLDRELISVPMTDNAPAAVETLLRWWRIEVRPFDAEAFPNVRAAAAAVLGREWESSLNVLQSVQSEDASIALTSLLQRDPDNIPRRDAIMSIALAVLSIKVFAQIASEQLRALMKRQVPSSQEWRSCFRAAETWAQVEAWESGRRGSRGKLPLRAPRMRAAPVSEAAVPVLDREIPRTGDGALASYEALSRGVQLRGPDRPISEVIADLRTEFPWFEGLIAGIEGEWRLAYSMGRSWVRFRPRLIYGPPGIGKSRFAARLAELSGTRYAYLSAAGSADNRALAGTAAGWSTATPSWPARVMMQNDCANPVLLVDEIDKTSDDRRNGRLIDSLLTMIEPVTSKAWPDDCLGGNLDLRRVTWLLCANSFQALDPTLLSRVETFEIGRPRPEHFAGLLAAIFRDISADFATDPALLPQLSVSAVASLEDSFARRPSIRTLRRAVETALAFQVGADEITPN